MSRRGELPAASQAAIQKYVANVVRRVRDAKDREGSYSALARAILHSPGNPERLKIERRKLAGMVEDQTSVELTVAEWMALDRYFADTGGIFRSLRQPRLADAIREDGHVKCFVGSRAFVADAQASAQRDYIDFVSLWDVQAAAVVRRLAYELREPMRFELEDVFVDEKGAANLDSNVNQLLTSLERGGSSTIVAIGSPRANPMSEALLRDFFPASQFRTPPFSFLYRRPKNELTGSRFCDKLERDNPAGLAGIHYDGKPYIYCRNSGHSYGVVCAKIRGGRIWLLLAGDIGASTLACAKVFESLPSEVTQYDPPIVVSWLVEATLIEGNLAEQRDTRSLDFASVVPESYRRWPMGGSS